MPIYEYACAKCESEFEVEQRITEDPLKTCPKCRSRKVKRLISRTSFVLKGGGWYSDLYSSKNNANAKDKSEGAAESGGESGAGAAKEGKSSEGASTDTKKDKQAKEGGKKKKGSPKAAA